MPAWPRHHLPGHVNTSGLVGYATNTRWKPIEDRSRLEASMHRMSLTLATLAFVLAAWGAPAPAAENAGIKMTPAQLDAVKKQLDATPQTPGSQAMMGKMLKIVMAMKAKKPVAPADMLALVAFLKKSNAGQAKNPAYAAAMRQLEANVLKLTSPKNQNNPDLDDLRKEFEGYGGDANDIQKEFEGY